MSKKHFEALAAALWNAKPIMHADTDYYKGWRRSVEAVTDTCARFNPNFDRARFLKACGVEV